MNSEDIARQWKFAMLVIIVVYIISWPFVAVHNLFRKKKK